MCRTCLSRCNFSTCFTSCCPSLLFFILWSIYWLIFQPKEVEFTITNASLTKFEYFPAPNNTIYYNLALNITLKNPNTRSVGLYVLRVQVIPYYGRKQFSLVTLNSSLPYYLGHKNTTVLPAKIQGQRLLLLEEKIVRQYNSETSLGFFSIDVKLALRVRAKYGKIKTMRHKPRKIDCSLKIPLSNSNGTTVNGYIFKATRCTNVNILIRPDDDY